MRYLPLASFVLAVSLLACKKEAAKPPAGSSPSGSAMTSDPPAPPAVAPPAGAPPPTAGSAATAGGDPAASLFPLGDKEKLTSLEGTPNPSWQTIGGNKVALAVIEGNVGDPAKAFLELRAKTDAKVVPVVRAEYGIEPQSRFDASSGDLVFEVRDHVGHVQEVGAVFATDRFKLGWDATAGAPVATAKSSCDDTGDSKKVPTCDKPDRWEPIAAGSGN
jgi:hypothetical protein